MKNEVKFTNLNLANAFRDWLERVRVFVQENHPKSKAIMNPDVRLIIHHEPGRSVYDEVSVPRSPSGLVYDYRDEVVKLEEYQKLIDLLEHTPETARTHLTNING